MTDDFDPINRELCPDGACIGVIGPNGRCRECGKPGVSSAVDPRNKNLRTEAEVADELEENIAKSDLDAAPDDFEDRQLCPDGACIGVIRDGVCSECGRPADERAD